MKSYEQPGVSVDEKAAFFRKKVLVVGHAPIYDPGVYRKHRLRSVGYLDGGGNMELSGQEGKWELGTIRERS